MSACKSSEPCICFGLVIVRSIVGFDRWNILTPPMWNNQWIISNYIWYGECVERMEISMWYFHVCERAIEMRWTAIVVESSAQFVSTIYARPYYYLSFGFVWPIIFYDSSHRKSQCILSTFASCQCCVRAQDREKSWSKTFSSRPSSPNKVSKIDACVCYNFTTNRLNMHCRGIDWWLSPFWLLYTNITNANRLRLCVNDGTHTERNQRHIYLYG